MFGPLSLNDPFTRFLFFTAAVMMLGFAVGRWTNQRRSRQISNWLEPGFRSLGGKPTIQRVSRSAFRFQTTEARRPFRTVTASVVLISREVFPTWLWEWLRGNSDLLVIHVTFRHSPSLEAEIVDPGNELGRRGEAQAKELNWPGVELPSRWRAYHGPDTSLSQVQALAKQIERSPFAAWRLATRRNAPHLLLSMPMPNLEQTRSSELSRLLTELAKLIPFEEGTT